MAAQIGDLLDGKYKLLRLIGEGGWGSVFEGENTRTKRHVAIKVLRPSATMSPEVLRRFEHEAQAASHIDSPHIVEVYDLGELGDGTHYLVMELLNGDDLAAYLTRSGALAPALAVKLLVQVLDGLGAAHDAGILHRDLKPENLFLITTKSGAPFVKILDFGVSKFNLAGSQPVSAMTRTGAVIGSPYYMAPEQARGSKQLDARTDLYSIGVVLYELLTNQVPFEGENFNELMFKIVLEARPDPRSVRPDLDDDLTALVKKGIACEPGDRFQTAAQFRAALVGWLEKRGIDHVVLPPKPRQFTPSASEPKIRQEQPWESATLPTPEFQLPRSGTGGTPGPSSPIVSVKSTEPESKETPVALASSRSGGQEKKPKLALIGGGLAAVAAIGIFLATRSSATEPVKPVLATASSASLTATATPTPPPTAPTTAPTTTAALQPAVADAGATAAVASLSPSPDPATPAARTPTRPHSAGHTSTPGPAATATTAATAAAAAATPTPDPKAPASTPDTVEVRTIRTGL
jgi:serine/threonine-protein kinase